MFKNKATLPLAALALVVSAVGGAVTLAHADTTTTPNTPSFGMRAMHERPAAVGDVTAISGSTITLTDKRSGTTYTVDAADATIRKHTEPGAPTTISLSQVAVGDTLMVRGTVAGTTITATDIVDGIMMGEGHGGHGIQGTVVSVTGNTLTVTGKDGKTYTVDAGSAAIGRIQTITTSDIKVGDSVGIQGAVEGTSITAKHIMDGILPPSGTGK